jgi:molecular chaperone HscB
MNELSSQASRDFFDLFSLESQYQIDLSQLKNRFRDLQIQYHPDKYTSSPESEKITAVKMSSLLNDGYEVLSDPVKRAKYLLENAGIDLQKDRVISQDILIEQMELREELENLLDISDVDEKEARLESLHDRLLKMFKVCDEVMMLKAKGDLIDELLLQELKQVLSRMLFINKLKLEVVKELENCF